MRGGARPGAGRPKIYGKRVQLSILITEGTIKNKNIIIFLTLIFILESSPTCVSPLFYYETNILGLNPKNLSLIDFYSQIAIIVVIIIYKNFCWKLNFKSITCFVRISIFGIFYLIYLLIIKITQKYMI